MAVQRVEGRQVGRDAVLGVKPLKVVWKLETPAVPEAAAQVNPVPFH